jgi:hypothetical protein
VRTTLGNNLSFENYQKLKFRYKAYFVFICWSGILVGFYPALQYALWLEGLFTISERDGWFDFLYLTGFFVCIGLGWLITTWFICKFKGWQWHQAMDYFIKYKNLPEHWFKK